MHYICTTCGAAADAPGHLCSPCDSTSSCTFSGAQDASAGHSCRDKPIVMQYVCSGCGRVAEERSHLCNPEPIME